MAQLSTLNYQDVKMIELDKKLKNNLDMILKMHGFTSFAFNVWVSLIAPLIVGYYITLYFNALEGQDPKERVANFLSQEAIPIVSIFLVHLLVSWWLFKQSKMSHTGHEFDKLKNKIVETEAELQQQKEKQNFVDYSIILMDIVTDLLKNNPKIDNQALYDNVLSSLNLFREELFKFGGEAKYNFVIYEYDAGSNKLKIKSRILDDRLQPQGRDWDIGVGHVGISFANKRCMICHDAAKSTELPMNESDAANYSSFISTPIVRPLLPDQSEPQPYGVLVVTSSAPNQFIAGLHDDFLRNLCDTLSIVITSNQEAENES
ncbi:hypothetical protein DN730_11010 [Marinomonas piezotolerans]|uniref:GAF domain-containing protein n=1 Tax=Marinomonas piezotolerans TaxID=2213058 RepID=A0A370U8Q4_9GAMM|nr:GAF domain-containing protein [Marinomonas piezotolerans]RDL44154.1 hypothetical protein DN730_11010 [Marinomonas piezotolerans]